MVRSKRDSVTSNPLATSTPLEGSPASAMHSICGSTDHALNSSEISAITVSTACGNNYEQDYAAQVKVFIVIPFPIFFRAIYLYGAVVF